MKSELERFEREKVEDFKSGVETFLEGAVEAQKEVCHCHSSSIFNSKKNLTISQLIELWETFLMQLDADEDGQPLYKPSVPSSGPPASGDAQRLSGEAAVGETAAANTEHED
jgi:sorting nexin-1/2